MQKEKIFFFYGLRQRVEKEEVVIKYKKLVEPELEKCLAGC